MNITLSLQGLEARGGMERGEEYVFSFNDTGNISVLRWIMGIHFHYAL